MIPRSLRPTATLASLALLAPACSGGTIPNDGVPRAQVWANPTEGRAPFTVDFAASTFGGDEPITYAWDFGDGATAEGEVARHTFEIPGSLTVVLSATDRDGDRDQAEVRISVTPGILGATLTAVPELGMAPLEVRFEGIVAGGTPPYTYQWTFGDGASSAEQAPSHTYVSPGDFDVTFAVTDSAGKEAQASLRVTATDTPVPLAAAGHADPVSGSAPLGVHFSATVNGGTPPYSYRWDFGDGTPASTEPAPFHAFRGEGTYDARLTVGDSGGNAETDTLRITVGPPVDVRINEIVYDTTGIDTNCFIELSGTPLASLDGFSLAGVGGSSGTTYASLSLTGQSLPDDGFFVVAQPRALAPTLAAADLKSEFPNLQNGPDNLLLLKDGVVVDAVGYGTFGKDDAFVGEGTPAPGVPPEHALARDAQGSDTDDNAADFHDAYPPTPGAPNG